MAISSFVSAYDQVILDLDGCVWVGDEPTPRAPEAIAALRAGGKRIAFVTNDARRPEEGYVRKLWGMGIQASLSEVVTVGGAVQRLLAQSHQGREAFVIGTESLRDHVGWAGLRVLNGTERAREATLVVVGGTEAVVYDDLRHAVLALRAGADFIGTSRDPTYPTEEGLWPGTGAILAAVEVGSGRTAEIVGKPEPPLFITALERLGRGRTLVVGDRLDVDVPAAVRSGLDAALVLTGGVTRADGEAAPDPVIVSDSLGALVLDS